MRKLIYALFLLGNCSYAQLYVSVGKFFNYVELFSDSARVEVFSTHCRHWCYTRYVHNEMLLPKRSGDTLFVGKQTFVLRKKGFVILCYKHPYKNKFKNVEVFRTLNDNRDSLRKPAYFHLRTEQMYRLLDSLSLYPTHFTSWARREDKNTLLYTYEHYKTIIDKKFDSVAAILIKSKDPRIDAFYRKADSLRSFDSVTICKLLSTTNYNLYTGQFLLRKAAKETPGILIHYLEKKPANKDTILKAIKFGKLHQDIVTSIKASSIKSPVKKRIIQQHRQLKAAEIGAAVLYVTIIVAEFTLLFLLFKWILGGV